MTREDAELAGALRALEDVDVEGAAHEECPVDAWGGREQGAGIQAIPVVDGEDVRREGLGLGDEGARRLAALRGWRAGAIAVAGVCGEWSWACFVSGVAGFGDDVAAPRRARGEGAVKADERVARWRDEGREAREELERGHDAELGSAIAEFLDAISEFAVAVIR